MCNWLLILSHFLHTLHYNCRLIADFLHTLFNVMYTSYDGKIRFHAQLLQTVHTDSSFCRLHEYQFCGLQNLADLVHTLSRANALKCSSVTLLGPIAPPRWRVKQKRLLFYGGMGYFPNFHFCSCSLDSFALCCHTPAGASTLAAYSAH